MRHGLRAIALVVCGSVAVASVQAQDTSSATTPEVEPPLISDRPDFTESPDVVGRGRVQLETGATFARETDADEESFGELLLRIGLGDRIELRLSLNSLERRRLDTGGSDTGVADAAIAAKFELNREARGSRPKLGLIIGADFPSGSEGFGEEDVQPGGVLAASWDLSPRFTLGSNLGYGYLSDQGERYSAVAASTALGYGVNDRVGMFFELYGTTPSGDRRDTYFFNTGTTWLLSPNTQLDARVGVGLNSAAADYFAGVGGVFRW